LPLFPQTRAPRGATRRIAELAFRYRLPRERKRPNSGTPLPLFPQTRAPRGATHPIAELVFRYRLPRERKHPNSGTPFPLFPQTRASRGATRLIAELCSAIGSRASENVRIAELLFRYSSKPAPRAALPTQ